MKIKFEHGWIKIFALIIFFCATLGFTLRANDFSITYDPKYFNPLAISFKWDIVLEKNFNIEQPFKIQYQLFSTKEGKNIWLQTNEIRLKENSFSIYLFITDIQNKKSGPFIRVETLPPSNVSTFEVLQSRFSNSVLFKGRRKIKGNFSKQINLVGTRLLKSNNGKVDKDFFSIMYIPSDTAEKRICNLNVDFFVKLIEGTKASAPPIK